MPYAFPLRQHVYVHGQALINPWTSLPVVSTTSFPAEALLLSSLPPIFCGEKAKHQQGLLAVLCKLLTTRKGRPAAFLPWLVFMQLYLFGQRERCLAALLYCRGENASVPPEGAKRKEVVSLGFCRKCQPGNSATSLERQITHLQKREK